jgi:hypothetical protein
MVIFSAWARIEIDVVLDEARLVRLAGDRQGELGPILGKRCLGKQDPKRQRDWPAPSEQHRTLCAKVPFCRQTLARRRPER